jgi:hypothetical protein
MKALTHQRPNTTQKESQMLEQLEEISGLYLAAAMTDGQTASLARNKLLAAFPAFHRSVRELVHENQRLRGAASAALVPQPSNVSAMEFVGYEDPQGRVDETGPVQSLHEMATQIGLLVGDEFVVTEIYRRFAHYRLTAGPNVSDPLALFNFEPPPAAAGGNPCARLQKRESALLAAGPSSLQKKFPRSPGRPARCARR